MARPEIEPKTPLAERLRAVRNRLGDPDREAFANDLAINKSTIAHYERGTRTPDANVLENYRLKFGVNINWLITGIGEMFDDPAQAVNHASAFQEEIITKLTRIILRVYKEAKIELLPERLPAEAIELYHDLARRVDDLTDMEEVEAVFPQIELRLKKRLSEARDNPRAGKREAS